MPGNDDFAKMRGMVKQTYDDLTPAAAHALHNILETHQLALTRICSMTQALITMLERESKKTAELESILAHLALVSRETAPPDSEPPVISDEPRDG